MALRLADLVRRGRGRPVDRRLRPQRLAGCVDQRADPVEVDRVGVGCELPTDDPARPRDREPEREIVAVIRVEDDERPVAVGLEGALAGALFVLSEDGNPGEGAAVRDAPVELLEDVAEAELLVLRFEGEADLAERICAMSWPEPPPYGAAAPEAWRPLQQQLLATPRRNRRGYTHREVVEAVREFLDRVAGANPTDRRWREFSRDRHDVPSLGVTNSVGLAKRPDSVEPDLPDPPPTMRAVVPYRAHPRGESFLANAKLALAPRELHEMPPAGVPPQQVVTHIQEIGDPLQTSRGRHASDSPPAHQARRDRTCPDVDADRASLRTPLRGRCSGCRG